MQRRLCMFVWSAQEAGLAVDLASAAAQKALYKDFRARSAGKNDGEPRFAYLRSTWEELERFARAIGLPESARQPLRSTLFTLRQLEAGQTPLKFAKTALAPPARALITIAENMLAEAHTLPRPQLRHAMRNRAAAIALGIVVPARPEDVKTHHVFGKGVVFDIGQGAWRFCYRPQKTHFTVAESLDLLLDRFWDPFIDALVLQDHDSAWLGEMRRDVIARQRPLYVNYDGSACAYAWYSRMWSAEAGTGGHIARTQIYDEMAEHGEFGIRYAKIATHHQTDRTTDRYRSRNAFLKSLRIGQDVLIETGSDDICDISNLF